MIITNWIESRHRSEAKRNTTQWHLIRSQLAMGQTWQTLGSLWRNFLHYVESFLILAIFWIKNHQQFHFIKKSDNNLLWLNIMGLLFVCLIPFTTSLVSDYGDVPIAAIVFEGNMLVAGSAYFLVWYYATKNRRLVDANIDERVIRIYRMSSLVTPLVSLAAILVSIFHPRIGTGLYFTIPFILVTLRRM